MPRVRSKPSRFWWIRELEARTVVQKVPVLPLRPGCVETAFEEIYNLFLKRVTKEGRAWNEEERKSIAWWAELAGINLEEWMNRRAS